MKLKTLLTNAGSMALNALIPGSVGLINAVLPADAKLPETATGKDAETLIRSLPEYQELLETEITAAHESLNTALMADAMCAHTTRPFIAKWTFIMLAVITLMITTVWCHAVVNQQADVIAAIVDGWPFLSALLWPFTALLLGYFGILRKENQNKLNAANGFDVQRGILDSLLSKR